MLCRIGFEPEQKSIRRCLTVLTAHLSAKMTIHHYRQVIIQLLVVNWLMPLSFTGFGGTAILVMALCLTAVELVKYLRRRLPGA
jgi:hypothetical protein